MEIEFDIIQRPCWWDLIEIKQPVKKLVSSVNRNWLAYCKYIWKQATSARMV